MKKQIIIICIIIFIASLSSCFVDFNSGKRPTDYKNTKWVSDDPEMYFIVRINHKVEYSQIIINDDVIELLCNFDYGGGIYFHCPRYNEEGYLEITNLSDLLFSGICIFSKDKLIVKIKKNNDFLDDSIKEIIFIREDIN